MHVPLVLPSAGSPFQSAGANNAFIIDSPESANARTSDKRAQAGDIFTLGVPNTPTPVKTSGTEFIVTATSTYPELTKNLAPQIPIDPVLLSEPTPVPESSEQHTAPRKSPIPVPTIAPVSALPALAPASLVGASAPPAPSPGAVADAKRVMFSGQS
jgi:hypothetical protein